ncbi:MAG TPA: hypothetical protein DF712_13505 [Balneola sp.]|nr:hypothetical protein [Balneola sp.]|tara:strand:+ start:627 stop:851 length:225 start_codon:yes stop_codon:yes gene_type:complete
MKFSNQLIANIARTLQIAILSGTDIVDHLRTFEIEEEDGELSLTSASLERIDAEIYEMLSKVEAERLNENTTDG